MTDTDLWAAYMDIFGYIEAVDPEGLTLQVAYKSKRSGNTVAVEGEVKGAHYNAGRLYHITFKPKHRKHEYRVYAVDYHDHSGGPSYLRVDMMDNSDGDNIIGSLTAISLGGEDAC